LDEWMRATHDPLLTGRVAPWPGYKVNLPTEPSPNPNTAIAAE
jgi:hypothetical protein